MNDACDHRCVSYRVMFTSEQNVYYNNNTKSTCRRKSSIIRHRNLLQLYEVRKTGSVLFNNALNTFYLQLYGIRHRVKDHSDSERGNLLLPHGLPILISSKGFYMHHPTDRIAYTTAFVISVVQQGFTTGMDKCLGMYYPVFTMMYIRKPCC